MRILVIDDNMALVANLLDHFERRGHVLDAAPDGEIGLQLVASHEYDLVVLDWMLPRREGPEILRMLREDMGSTVPVIMLTARAELVDKIAGFRAGADDYLTKPFALGELEARIEAIVQRTRGRAQPARLRVDSLVYDLQTLVIERAGRVVTLYPLCRRILEVLMRASPAAVPRERLEEALWGDRPPPKDALRAHMYALRRNVDAPGEPKLVHTLPRIGYRIGPAEDVDPHGP
ncbi:response regulator transcription factor [Dokdonella sp. MW10]|uniref:response regulator transcription factor n=1 Tax=Dokdonella sp. MW10 TaxID=2992926 RepID=UPI003F7D3697